MTKLIFYKIYKISFNTSNRIIHPQTTTSTLNQQYLDSNHHRHANHNIYTETATSTLKPQHLPSNHNICTQTTTSAFKPQQLHSKNNIFTQPIKSSLKPHNTYSQTTQHLLSNHNIQWRHYGCANGAPHRGPWAEGAHPSPILLTDCTGRHNTIDNYYRRTASFY